MIGIKDNPGSGTVIAVRNAQPGLLRVCDTPRCNGLAVKEIYAMGRTHGFCRHCVDALVKASQDEFREQMKGPIYDTAG